MRVCGIIAEYDPFHLGHLHHVREARRLAAADYVVCVISTAFTQRGMPALFSTHDRARMALEAGADLVLALPVSWSCAQANRFAAGGVGILSALGAVTHLAFGVEPRALPWLHQAAQVLRAPPPKFSERFEQALSQGCSVARAQGEALKHVLPAADTEALQSPNFSLAVCYLQALRQQASAMEPVPIPRAGAYHATRLAPLPSATAVRAALLRGDWQGVKQSVPQGTYALMAQRMPQGMLHLPHALDAMLLGRLLAGDSMAGIAEISEGLDLRIRRMARLARGREELVHLIKTKRYPHTRIQRALTGVLLGLKANAAPLPPYARVLGMRKQAAPLLQRIKQGGFALITRPARERNPYMQQDMLAEQLWYLGAGQPGATAWRQKMPVI